MLRSFRVANHKSIRDEQELLLIPTYDKGMPVLPVAGIFGANASGKSNLLDALAWMRDAVMASFGWGPRRRIPRLPFRLDKEMRQAPSSFVVDLILDGVQQVYGFEVDDQRVREEWLYAYPHGRKRVIFEREGAEWTFGSTVPHAKFEAARELTRPNALFLTVAGNSGLTEVDPVYGWFQEGLTCIGPADHLDLARVAEFVERSNHHKRTLIDLLRAADLGISDVTVMSRPDVDDVLKFVKKGGAGDPSPPSLDDLILVVEPVVFTHGTQTVMTIADESLGTRAWLKLLAPTLVALENGGAVCVDEIDSSLHPHLSARLIDLFQDEGSNRHGAQLLFTTHDATLLSPALGADALQRDQIWFMEKGENGASRLFPLSDFHPRQGENTARRYLGGSYGAIPFTSQYAFRAAIDTLVSANGKS